MRGGVRDLGVVWSYDINWDNIFSNVFESVGS